MLTALQKHVVNLYGDSLARDHPTLLAVQRQLGIFFYLFNKQLEEAADIFEHVSNMYKADKVAEDHPDILTVQHDLGTAFSLNEQVKDAVELLEHVVKIKSVQLAEDHLGLLESLDIALFFR